MPIENAHSLLEKQAIFENLSQLNSVHGTCDVKSSVDYVQGVLRNQHFYYHIVILFRITGWVGSRQYTKLFILEINPDWSLTQYTRGVCRTHSKGRIEVERNTALHVDELAMSSTTYQIKGMLFCGTSFCVQIV